MIADTHVHVTSDDRQTYPMVSNPASWAARGGVSTEKLIAAMDGAGVDRAILVQAFGAYRYDNTYHADSAALNAERTVAICIVDPFSSDAPEALSYWITERGVRGLRLFLVEALDDPRTFPVWERARALAIPVCVFNGITSDLERIAKLRTTAARFPEVPVALDHMFGWSGTGAPRAEVTQGLFDLAALPNIYMKFSTTNLAPFDGLDDSEKDMFRRILDAFTPQRLMWGSNYPASEGSYGDMANLGRRSLPFLSENDRRWLLADTALKLWPRLKGSGA